MKGYYSVIQYCPDLSRAEAANVGVVLFTENPRQFAVKVSETLARVEQFFRPDAERLGRVTDAVRATADRVRVSADEFATADDWEQFTRAMGNDVRMTLPRVVRVGDLHQDLLRLFDELVGDGRPGRKRRAVVLPTTINRVLETLSGQQRVWAPGKVRVPVVGRQIEIPFAYRNGVINYIKPALFADDGRVDGKAAKLAIEGDQLQKHPEQDVSGPAARRLVVVSASASAPDVEDRVAPIFLEYGVVFVPTAGADRFAAKLMAEAK